jgi:hypothetical protein
MDMPQFPLSEPQLYPAEAMGCHRDLFPSGHDFSDPILCSSERHDLRPSRSVRWMGSGGK